jgi:signal transduction histidine kinase
MTLGNMGLAYVSLTQPHEALKCYEQSAAMFEEIGDRKGLAQTWNNMGLTYSSLQDYPAAVSFFQRSLELSRALGARGDVCITLVNIAQVYIKMDTPREALPYVEEGRAMAEAIGAKASLRDSYATLADLHTALGDHATALEYFRQYAETKDTIYNQESSKRIAEMEVRYETAQKEKEKEIYRLRNVELVELNEQITAQKEELARTLDELRQTQKQLVESEKMAALGGLVSGVAHEINTPVGIGITAASGIADRTEALHELYSAGRMKRSDLEKYMQFARESSALMLSNLERTGNLIQSFKQVSVDQTSDQHRTFKLAAYLHDIMRSLEPRLKPARVEVAIECDPELSVDGYPGVLAQIVTNLALNAVVHAFKGSDGGRIALTARVSDGALVLQVADNGSGMTDEVRTRIFDPFFTTSRQAGTGLGLHIVYNLVTQRLRGQIQCESSAGAGTTFTITLPITGAAHEFGTPS